MLRGVNIVFVNQKNLIAHFLIKFDRLFLTLRALNSKLTEKQHHKLENQHSLNTATFAKEDFILL